MARSLTSRNWAHLQEDILGLILDKLVPLSDYIRFSAVCKSWNFIASDHKQKQKRMRLTNHQLPWQLVITLDGNGEERLALYNYSTSRISDFKLRIPDKFNSLNSCQGSSHGWLVFSENLTSLVILNPLSGTIFHLPPVCRNATSGGCQILHAVGWLSLIDEVVLSKDPFSGSFEVLAVNIFRNVVAHLKFGDEFWSYSVHTGDGYFKSVAFYKDSLLAACNDGIVSLEKINGGRGDRHESSLGIKICGELNPKLKKIYTSKGGFCLVESTKGDLLMVCKSSDFCHVFKIVELNDRFEHIPIANLDGHSLFVGKNDSILVLASNYPGCRPNSVYYSSASALKPWHPRYENILKYVFEIQEFNFEDDSVRDFSTVETRTEYQHKLAVSGAVPWIVPSMKF